MTLKYTSMRRRLVMALIGMMSVAACTPVTPSGTETELAATSTMPTEEAPTETPAPVLTSTELPTTTAVLETQTPEPIPTTTPIVDDGVYFPVPWIRLEYDLSKWRKTVFVPETSFLINWSEPTLIHKQIAQCYLGANNPRDFGPGFEMQRREEVIGGHLYLVREFFSESDKGQIPAIVYGDLAVEYAAEGAVCISDAKEVLATYTEVQP